MKKSGFTLVEIIGVITIMGFLFIIVMPNVINMFYNNKTKYEDVDKRLIEEAARTYNEAYRFDNDSNTSCISVQSLIDNGFLDINAVTAIEDYSNGYVKVEGYKYTYQDSSC